MWTIIQSGEKVALGDTVRFIPSGNSSPFKEKIFQVFKTEQHYFEIVVKQENDGFMDNPVRRIVRYIDIGYHIGMEVWMESSQATIINLYEDVSKQDFEHSYISASY
ncbi:MULTISPECIES: hypothetical protein [Niastella]|uniref:Uncharacterized protein n=1 Tax=Niastella soli TaxID=2821487 RepID=A0ABS3YYQ2_9BACT|nr:hypothetical protein [Niastella soli]MBO9203054.1 hypothetical protein [Niastella soli]